MGYTHYWSRPQTLNKDTLKSFVADCKKIFEHCKNKLDIELVNYMGDEGTEPEANDEGVFFNGSGDESHEGLVIEQSDSDSSFNFCKTNMKPYDVAVTAVLIALNHHFPECKITSDGNTKDWDEGRRICSDCLGYGVDFKLG